MELDGQKKKNPLINHKSQITFLKSNGDKHESFGVFSYTPYHRDYKLKASCNNDISQAMNKLYRQINNLTTRPQSHKPLVNIPKM